jgi:hypothetical protein
VGTATLLEIIQHRFPEAKPDATSFLQQQLEYYPPVGEDLDPEGFENFLAKKRAATKRKTEGGNPDEDREEGTSQKRCWLQRKVVEDGMDVDTDVPIRDRSASQMSIPEVVDAEKGWPVGYRMVDSPLTDLEGVACLSGLSMEEKEKEKTPWEMEIEDVTRPSGNPAANAAPVAAPVKVEEEENVNRVRYEIVEVAPSEPVVEEMLAMAVGGEAVVEPKPELVEPVIPPVIVPWMKKERKKLRITTRKITEKEVIEILHSEDEMPVEEGGNEESDEEEGKEPDAKNGDGQVLDS